ncbi:superoxide dismutase family protein [Novosphingobium piscinae]|uniref:Superoxide dismutase family protein n=1 Tax=Novosphingobium piscinae TaxID=1507448 RepID=A0A7X1KQU2_9SPHN|nr:superoxide dismutase family protein [Novosphingobium piscinae]
MPAALAVAVPAALVVAGPAAATAAEPTAPALAPPLATARLVHSDGTPAGLARIISADGHAVIVVEITGVPAGPHGLHLHAVGQCAGPAFLSAGSHLNPAAKAHGIDNPAGSHLGDLPNLTADAQGRISARIHFAGDPQALATALFDADGSALVLHAGPDDYKTDPAGNSGSRIVCGVLTKG